MKTPRFPHKKAKWKSATLRTILRHQSQ